MVSVRYGLVIEKIILEGVSIEYVLQVKSVNLDVLHRFLILQRSRM